MTFEELKITRQFLNAIEDWGFENPTEIQVKAIPPIRSGQDIIGIAQTGTGKTAAYLLPILQKLNYAHETAPRGLILCPTKELVIQVHQHAKHLSSYTDLRIEALYGGVGYKIQGETVEKGVDLIIATPGRFMDIYLKGYIEAKKIKTLILDEADRMMDMGFMPQLRSVFEIIPSKRQNLLFSATFPEKVQHLADEFLLWPTRIEVTPESTAVETVEQFLYEVPNFKTKADLLIHLLNEREDMTRLIVFTGTKFNAENLSKYLERKTPLTVRAIHSNKGQNSRINAMSDFAKGEVDILVSTDVAARGIDIPEVSHVINFNIPKDYHDYVHRIGRTGRAFKAGEAISFADRAETYHVKKIEELINEPITLLEMPEEVEILRTPKDEFQDQAREIDRQKKRENPDYKGAFHKKKDPAQKKREKRERRKKK
ncbi:MAG: DEAD/DEAH box helicase [Flavobacteriales bacterium]|nr:DEAD/DEAH box helicase [Flavobacteriales bacterium]